MERAIITAKGKVQRAGYRDYVLDLAVELGVVGYVENQLDGTVLIVGEAEKDILEDFIRKLKPEDDPLVRVDTIDTKYEEPTGEFKYFEIRRGSSDDESGERLDTAQKALKALIKTNGKMNVDLGNKIDKGNKTLGEKIDNVAEKQDQMLGKQDQTIESINKGFAETKQDFTTLRSDYGKISKTMEKILDCLVQQQKDSTEATNRLTAAILKLAEKR